MRDVKELRSEDPKRIYCIGDNQNILKFDVGFMGWVKIKIFNDPKSFEAFDGTLRYTSSCFIPACPDERIYLTGGCYSTNGYPSNKVAEFSLNSIARPQKRRPMHHKRYGHLSVYLNGILYCIGGFTHKDLPKEPPSTLGSCERFTVNAEKGWKEVNSLCEPRAFSSCITFNSQYLYVFGGMQDYTVLSSIEKYDTFADEWKIMYFKLPMPISKLGAVLIDDENIIIAGGMS